ncbi:MAG: CAP domain-containing protein [Chthoniobacteraceae bacterium]
MDRHAHMTPTPLLTALAFKAVRVFAVAFVVLFSGLFSASVSRAAEVNAQELAIFNLMKNASGQRRASVTLDPILCRVARAKAADMAARGYFAHVDPSGRGANYLVRQAGYSLPAGYDMSVSGNNIESLSAGRESTGAAWNDWMSSSLHKQHLLGEVPFFAAQTSVGVGFVNVPGSQWQWYWVVLTAPPSGPQLSITAPASGAQVNDPFVTVRGTAGGEPLAASVRVRVENSLGEGAWTSANGTTSWSAQVDGLAPGANTLRIESLSAGGAVLRTATRNIRYVVLAPVVISLTGSGSITAGFAGTSLREVGRSYTITATPLAGSIFAGWSGGATTLSRTLTFSVPEGGLALAAAFIPNPFLAGAGGYAGLFTGSDGTRGVATLSLGSNGLFTGRLRLNGQSLVFKGRFDATGAARVNVATYALTLTYANASISGTVSGEGWSADLALDGLVKPDAADPHAGRYTLVLPSTQAPGAPSGDGAATVSVSTTGVVTLSGALADGAPFLVRARLTRDGEAPIFAQLYSGAGVLTGALQFREQEVNELDGSLRWSRPDGLSLDLATVGSRYRTPALDQPVVPVSDGANNTALSLGDGGLAATLVQPATLSRANAITISAPTVAGLSARINPLRGNFGGTFIHPQTGAAAKFRGVILQKQGAGFGFFAAGIDTGYATFAPAGTQARLAAP